MIKRPGFTFRYTAPILAVSLLIAGLLLLFGPAAPAPAQSRDDCLACHDDKELSIDRKGRQVSLYANADVLDRSAHRKLACVACHAGFDPGNIPHKEKIGPVRCSSCHQNAVQKHQFHAGVLRARSSAGSLEAACKECHGTHDVSAMKGRPGSPSANTSGTCERCHAGVADHFRASAHGKALASGVPGAPRCLDCHTQELAAVTAGGDTATVKRVQDTMCLACHLDNPDVRSRASTSTSFISDYGRSVHGAALARGNGRAPGCVNCHGSHEMQQALDPASRTNKARIPDLCGGCHAAIARDYRESSHGVALARGVKEAPSCTDCHGEHNILHAKDPASPVSAGNVSSKVCAPCHGSVRLSEKYGISSNRIATFNNSYHGLAMRGGQGEVANCASCHGVHTIKPSSDPTSSVNKANLTATCGKCHPGANTAFTQGKIHVTEEHADEPILFWLATMYLILIGVIIGGMFLHNVADFRRKAITKLKIRRGELPPAHQVSHRLYLRMTTSERLQHGTLLVSFFLLVITGFMLHFPDAWWVVWIRGLSESVVDARGIIHRCAGVVMIAASVYHALYLGFTRRGRELFVDLLPRLSDLRDAIDVLKYNFGFSRVKPLFGRFSYIEKSEYWALVWGNIVMGATGFIMWFDNTFMGIFTKLGWDIARTVHYYEAWLAFLAIVVWHLYFVIFNPDVYPVNLAWLKGTLSEEEMAEEHPLELDAIHRREAAEREAAEREAAEREAAEREAARAEKPGNGPEA